MKYQPPLTVLLFLFLAFTSFTAIDYTGDNLLLVLDSSSASKEFKAIKDFWLLDKSLQNEYGGIKITLNNSGRVQSVLIAGDNFQLNGIKFLKCSSPLPFKIMLSDDTAVLNNKLGTGQKIIERNAIKYYQGDVAIEIAFTDLKAGKISFVKFYNEVRPEPKPILIIEEQKESTTKIKLQEKRRALEDKTFTAPVAKIEKIDPTVSEFKKALLSVFNAYKESNFFSVKNGLRNSGNFWHYQYTYSTKIKIPGEKFNLLYSFPFTTSPLDFVSVLKEADGDDASFQTTYKEFEEKLMQNFPTSEGWTSSCIPNKESKTLSDLEWSNDRYGSIVLDYSKNPNGKHILYLRFLLYSN